MLYFQDGTIQCRQEFALYICLLLDYFYVNYINHLKALKLVVFLAKNMESSSPPPPLQCILFLNVCSLVHKHHQLAILSVVDRILHTVPYYASVAWLMFWTQQCTKRILSILNQLHQDFTLNKIGLRYDTYL